VAAATGGSRVGDGGQIAEQVRWFGLLERVGIAQWGQGPTGSGMMGRQARAFTVVMRQ
jgi:hypothetical protein